MTLALDHNYWTHCGTEALASVTLVKKRGVKTSFGGQERFILIPNWDLP